MITENITLNNEKLYLEIVSSMGEGAYFVNLDRVITFWNSAAEDITGYKKEEILGRHCQDTPLQHVDGEGQLICIAGCPLHQTLTDGQPRKHNLFFKHKDGHRVPVAVGTFPVKENDLIIGAIEIFTLSSLLIYDDDLIIQLSSSALNDQLTGIPNRRKVESYLVLRLREMAQQKSKICVVFLDIDKFRDFNNSFGHDAGDAVLCMVSKTIMSIIRNQDIFGRWGGEEFIGVFTIADDSDVFLIGEKIRALVERSVIRYTGHDFSVSVSIGVTLARGDDTIESVVKRADELMYISKQRGRNCVTTDEV